MVACAVVCSALAVPARAELVFFDSGRTLSVRSHRTDGDLLVLTLRDGGEIVCDRSVIARIGPDEVPYPEPEAVPEPPSAPPVLEAVRYATIIDRVAAEQGVDARLVRAVIQVESGYHERARSPKGAMGLMQLMPETARRYHVANPYDPRANIEAGIRHLKAMLEQFPADRFPLTWALAAYNAGEEAVRRFQGIPPYAETRLYVERILHLIGR